MLVVALYFDPVVCSDLAVAVPAVALGLDRVVMLLSGEKSIREVIAFAKTTAAVDLMAESPSGVDKDQLDQLGIQIKGS